MYLGLGTNLGDRRTNLARALDRLADIVAIDAVSSVHATEPVGIRDQPEFWNMAVRGRTKLGPADLLAAIKRIETELGREPGPRFGPRLIDIDILLMDEASPAERTGAPEIPHPRMMERAFVLRPLVEIEPGLVHPTTGQPLAERLAEGTFERTRRLFPGQTLFAGARS